MNFLPSQVFMFLKGDLTMYDAHVKNTTTKIKIINLQKK